MTNDEYAALGKETLKEFKDDYHSGRTSFHLDKISKDTFIAIAKVKEGTLGELPQAAKDDLKSQEKPVQVPGFKVMLSGSPGLTNDSLEQQLSEQITRLLSAPGLSSPKFDVVYPGHNTTAFENYLSSISQKSISQARHTQSSQTTYCGFARGFFNQEPNRDNGSKDGPAPKGP